MRPNIPPNTWNAQARSLRPMQQRYLFVTHRSMHRGNSQVTLPVQPGEGQVTFVLKGTLQRRRSPCPQHGKCRSYYASGIEWM
jgi:hypothetical protein